MVRDQTEGKGGRALVVGILNVTPDSFSDGGRYLDVDAAVARARRMVSEGADWIDVGGESTRPGAPPVDAEEECRRVLPVIAAIAELAPVSVDTRKAVVAARALAVGARIINDVSAMDDPEMPAVSADADAIVLMHMRGTPATMTRLTDYDDVVTEVRDHLLRRAERARAPQVWLDPGIGFAKTAAQSLALLRGLPDLVATGYPVMVGASRKSFIGATLGLPDPADRLPGSLAAAAAACMAGARALRVHDVRPTRQVVEMMAAIAAARP
ncbi:MAG: dihydropteroate synthase [Deltaproteobacteria bacterium]|nr:MAG: dihydropteroate synthase [Deltaproteobacteria bacterium]